MCSCGWLLPGVPASGTQPQITTHVAAPAKSVRIVHCQHVGQRDQCPHTFDLFQQSHFGDALLVAICSIRRSYSAIRWFSDATSPNSGSKAARNSALNPAARSLLHLLRAALAQPLSVGFRQPSRGIHQRRARSHQRGPRPDHRQMDLRFRAAMLHRTQQAGIDPRQPCQHPGVEPIIFSAAFPDQPHVPRMRHDHFMSQLGQLPADPRRMRPGLQRDSAARHSAEHLLHPCFRRRQLLLRPALRPLRPARSSR